MAFSSFNPYQYLAVYFDFFAEPVMQLSNLYTIYPIVARALGLAAVQPLGRVRRVSKGILHTTLKYVPNNQYISTHSRLFLNDILAMQWHSHP